MIYILRELHNYLLSRFSKIVSVSQGLELLKLRKIRVTKNIKFRQILPDRHVLSEHEIKDYLHTYRPVRL